MAHAEHFLERLDRVPRSLSDFALELYRDPERVRWIIHYAHLPKDEERVAFALDAGGEGPYIVVTREGHFVTALGAEMTPKNLTILSRAQVDAFSARVDDARSRLELAKEVVPPGKPPEDVIRLLMTRAWALSREEISAIAAWVPILGMRFLAEIYERYPQLENIRGGFLSIKHKRYRKDPRTKDSLDLIWNFSHGIGARFVLATMGDLAFAEPWAKSWKLSFGPTYLATAERMNSVAMRGAWAAARMGKAFIPIYKKILATPGNMFVRFDAALAMTAIGIRHSRLREEARRIVATMVPTAEPENLGWTKSVVAASERAFDDPEGAMNEVASFGAKVMIWRVSGFSDNHPLKVKKEEDVPREQALRVIANHSMDSVHSFAMYLLPWVAKLHDPAELYFPEEVERPLRMESTAEQIEEIFERRTDGKPESVTREGPKIGRNDPCSCGSGTKFKRCCGR